MKLKLEIKYKPINEVKPYKFNARKNAKAVKMAQNFIVNSSRPGENVLEPFAGSGSTLIACENKKRNCYAIEFSEDFCSHIIERWEKITGKKATNELKEPLKLRK